MLNLAVHKLSLQVAITISATALLAGCSINTEEIAASYVAPGKFELLNCQEIHEQSRGKFTEIERLKILMDKARQSPGGDVAVVLAYRTEYTLRYGEFRMLQDTAIRKNCDSRQLSISERSLW